MPTHKIVHFMGIAIFFLAGVVVSTRRAGEKPPSKPVSAKKAPAPSPQTPLLAPPPAGTRLEPRIDTWLREGVSPKLALDSALPDYDATKLEVVGFPPAHLFAREKRDEVWARQIEPALEQAIRQSLAATQTDVAGMSVECRTNICRLELGAAAGADSASAAALQIGVLADRVTFGDTADEPGKLVVYMTHAPAGRGVPEWRQRLRQSLTEYIEQARQHPDRFRPEAVAKRQALLQRLGQGL